MYAAFGDDLGKASQEALAKTKELLLNAQQRGEHIKNDKQAQKADDIVKNLGGTPEQQQDIYKLAATIFEKMIKENGGDATEVQRQLLQKPETFAGSLNPDQMEKLRKIANDIQKNDIATSPH